MATPQDIDVGDPVYWCMLVAHSACYGGFYVQFYLLNLLTHANHA